MLKEAQTKTEIRIKWTEIRTDKFNAVFSLPREDNVKIGEGN